MTETPHHEFGGKADHEREMYRGAGKKLKVSGKAWKR